MFLFGKATQAILDFRKIEYFPLILSLFINYHTIKN